MPLARPFVKECGAAGPSAAPSLLGLAGDFAAASLRWLAAGMPCRSAAQIESIYREQCAPCERFVPAPDGADEGTCGACSCRLAPTFHRITDPRNKIGWKTEGCPLGRWQAEAAAKPASRPCCGS